MAKWKDRIRRWSTQVLDIPEDVIVEVPRVTMVGPFQLYVENHRGVAQFSNRQLTLRLPKGELAIKGKNLVIRIILPTEIMVEGIVESVHFLHIDLEKKEE
jgi:sporulation protein YqfC